jgi:hypothetical protein
MKRFSRLLVIVAILASLSPASAQEQLEEFSVIVLPDTQYYSLHFPEVFQAQTKWIAENIEKHNIKFVIGVGDITHNDTPEEWKNADAALKHLDGVVPYVLALGNHDFPDNGSTRDTTFYNQTFPLERLQLNPGWGDRMGEDNDNHWREFEAMGEKFMVLTVEFGPTDEILEWANQVVAAHPEHKVIVTTHCYMNCDDTRVGNEDGGRPQNYKVGGNDGQDIWHKFIRKHENIFFVVSGHIICDESQGLRIDQGDHGNRVVQILTNYQDRPMGGNGWLKIIRFVPERGLIFFTAYSPFLDRYTDGAKHTFRVWHRLKESK